MKLKNCVVFLAVLMALAVSGSFALALPDLTIANVLRDPSASVCSGQYQVLVFDIKNIGDTTVTNQIVELYVGSQLYKSITGMNINTGGFLRKILTVPVSSSSPISLKVDTYNWVAESNEANNIYSFTPLVTSCSSTPNALPLKRLYKSADRDHFYTIKTTDYNNAVSKGYVYEKDEGKLLSNYVPGTLPFLRFYNPASTSHFYNGKNDIGTMQYLMDLGYAYEGIEGYIYTSQLSGTLPLYHSYKPADIDNFYTINYAEFSSALTNGYQDKGIEGYVYNNDPALPDLAVSGISASPSASCSGQTVTVNYNLQNIGNAAVSNAQIAGYENNVLKSAYAANLSVGQISAKTYSYVADSSPKTIKVVADYTSAITESNEGNNQASLTVNPGSCSTPKPLTGKIIVLDPGHMPSEADRIKSGEYYATHNISKVLKPMLENLGATVYETIITDNVDQRPVFANGKNANLYVSIHFNAGNSTDTTTTGLEAFYGEESEAGSGGSPENDKAVCRKLIPEVQKLINSKLRPPTGTDSGIKSDLLTFYKYSPVLRKTSMPACLVEMEYITTVRNVSFNGKTYTSHKSLFLSADYTNAAANALKNAIINYFNGTFVIAITNNSNISGNNSPSNRVGWLPTGELYIPKGVLTGYCYLNATGIRQSCTILGKDVRISGAFDWYAEQKKFFPQKADGCGLSEASFKQAFYSATPDKWGKGFSLFYNQSGTKYWLEVNASHPDILKDGTYQIMPTQNISTAQGVCS